MQFSDRIGLARSDEQYRSTRRIFKLNQIVCIGQPSISCKSTESRGFTKLKSKFSIDDVETKKAFSLIRTCICETYVQCFQFKILNDILFTNSRLVKIGLIQSDLCTFCNIGVETVDHLFFYCVYSRVFWDEFESYWFAIAKEQRKLELKTILLGVTDTKCPLFNYLRVPVHNYQT